MALKEVPMGYGSRTFQDNLRSYKKKSSLSRAKKWLKRVNNRIRRREEKRDPENARTRDRYFYWAC